MKRWQEEQEEVKKAEAEHNKRVKADTAEVEGHITINELKQPYYITNLVGGIGKESTIDELNKQTIQNAIIEKKAQIAKEIYFKDEKIYSKYCNMFLHDFNFINGGGTAKDEAGEYHIVNSIAIYLNDKLMLVIDPEGCNYSRYVFKPTNQTKIINMSSDSVNEFLKAYNLIF